MQSAHPRLSTLVPSRVLFLREATEIRGSAVQRILEGLKLRTRVDLARGTESFEGPAFQDDEVLVGDVVFKVDIIHAPNLTGAPNVGCITAWSVFKRK